MPQYGLAKMQAGGALDLHIREKIETIGATDIADNTFELTGQKGTASTALSLVLLDEKFVPLQWRMAPGKMDNADAENKDKLFVGYNKYESLEKGMTRDRTNADDFLTPTRKLPTGQGNVQYDPSDPANSRDPRAITASVPEGTKAVRSGNRLQKSVPLRVRLEGSLMLSGAKNKNYNGLIWFETSIGTVSFVHSPITCFTPKLHADIPSTFNIRASDLSFISDNSENVLLDSNEGTQIKVTLKMIYRTAGVEPGGFEKAGKFGIFLKALAKNGGYTEGAGNTNVTTAGGAVDPLDINLYNPLIDISQVSSGIDQVN